MHFDTGLRLTVVASVCLLTLLNPSQFIGTVRITHLNVVLKASFFLSFSKHTKKSPANLIAENGDFSFLVFLSAEK